MATNPVMFKKGSYTAYKALTPKDANTIYFCEDTLQIFQGDKAYTQLIRSGEGAPSVDAPLNSMYIDTTAVALYLHNGTAWELKAKMLSDVITSGGGNVVTGFTFVNGQLTLVKGMTAASSDELGAVEQKVDDHAALKNNPHVVTAAQTGAYTKEETEAKIEEMITDSGAHTHGNQATLDKITEQNLTDWNDAVAKEHTHENKDLLDTYDQTNADLKDAVEKKHAHANAEELAKIADGDKAKWDNEIGAKQAAADALAEAKKKVASVGAGDASVAISGTATAPTVAAKLSQNAGNILTLKTDGLFVPTPAAATVTGVKSGEKVLGLEGTELYTTLALKYDEVSKKLQILGTGNAVVTEIDATAFIKDGMLDSASYDEESDELVLKFNTDAGKEDIHIPLSDLVYTSGDGINITSNKIKVVIDPASEGFLTVGAAGVKLSGVQSAIDAAKNAAITDAEGKNTALKNELTGAIGTAKQEAIDAAAADATSKANAAKSAAIEAAGTAADQKIEALNLGTMSQKAAEDYDTSAQVDAKIDAAVLVWGTI